MSLPRLDEFLAAAAFSNLDRRFARHLDARAAAGTQWVGHAAALASLMLRNGHPCMSLEDASLMAVEGLDRALRWPDAAAWRKDLLGSGLVTENIEHFLPLFLDTKNRLYLHRYAEYEHHLAADVRSRIAEQRFSAIVGGPGTGKTYTILQTIVARLEANPSIRIVLAAPTGKAAQRMEESIRAGLTRLTVTADLAERIPRHAATLHRLLGARADSAFFRHDAEHPLVADLVIVDEASMVDLPLMAKLLAALPSNCELMLVGDPDQLASVEAGAVLADIVAAGEDAPATQPTALSKSVKRLLTQHRYGPQSGIGVLCEAIRRGDAEAALTVLEDPSRPDVRLRELPAPAALAGRLRDTPLIAALQAALKLQDAGEILQALAGFRILCPTRRGPCGMESLNTVIENILHEDGVIDRDDEFYAGRTVLVTRNDYGLQLFNGDSAVIVHDPKTREVEAAFIGEHGQLRLLPVARLPAHQTNFAMTVHRSQGSEFDRVLIVLPPGQSPLLTRELLYTAVSRAKQDVEIWADPQTVRIACARRVRRTSGLRDRLVPESRGSANSG